MSEHILSIIWLTPLIGMFVVMCLPKDNRNLIRYVANGFAILGVLVTIPLIRGFDSANAEFQFVERLEWIPSLGADAELCLALLGRRRRRGGVLLTCMSLRAAAAAVSAET